MFERKITQIIEEHLKSNDDRIMLIDGARQIGKTYIINYVCNKLFKNYVEINLLNDYRGPKNYADIKSCEELYFQLSIDAKGKLNDKSDTIVFLDEIQVYPDLLTLLKFLKQDGRYKFIVSGSMLGVALKKTTSVPMGSIKHIHMYPMDFEEFLYANSIDKNVIEKMRQAFNKKESLPIGVHESMLTLFKYYLISGGLPEAVSEFVINKNIYETRQSQARTYDFYSIDAAQYDEENKLKIMAIYKQVVSLMQNIKKRIVVRDIDNKKGETIYKYREEFEYLTAAGIALDVKAISTPVFPLSQRMEKNLLKLYLNDPGLLSYVLYGNNINAILNDELSINLGSVYETAVACELKAHGNDLYYYDRRKSGEVDFLINDYDGLQILPIEIKSGKDYSTHASLDKFIKNKDYSVNKAYVFSNNREIKQENKITYFPIYMIMFIKNDNNVVGQIKKVNIEDW